MIDKKNYKYLFFAIIILFIAMSLLSVYLISKMMADNNECLANPFVYSAKTSYDNGMEISCSCYPYDDNNYIGFSFDRFNISVNEQ